MCNANDTSRIEIRQADRPGEQPPGGLTKEEKGAIRELNKQLAPLGKKVCNTCSVEQDLEQGFYKQDKGRSYFARCKACSQAALNKRRRSRDGLEQALENGYYRAKGLDLPAHKITREELLVYWDDHGISPWKCFHTGVDLVREPYQPNSRTIDHVQPMADTESAGHVLENVVPCSRDYNRYKSATNAVLAVLNRDPEQFPGVEYPGPVDEHGNPLAPAQVEWSEGTSAPVVITLDSEGKQVLE